MGKTGCDHDIAGSDIQPALDAAKARAGDDTVKLGDGAFSRSGGFSYDDPDPVHIEGTGGRASRNSALFDTASTPSNHTVLKVVGNPASTISGVDVSLPGGSGTNNTGIDTTGTVSDVLVEGVAAGDGAAGVRMRSGAVLERSTVGLGLAHQTSGVALVGSSISIADSRIEASFGIYAPVGGGAGAASVTRSRIGFGSFGIDLSEGSVTIDDSLLEFRPESGANPIGLAVLTSSDASIVANHVTLVGPSPAPSTDAVDVVNGGSGVAAITFRNGIISGWDKRFNRSASGTGPANIATDYSDYPPGTDLDIGTGSITETNHIDVAPGFESATDSYLRPDSPLVDAADPAETGGLDGNGDCTARRDIGAFEFTPGPRAPHAVASASLDGDTATFDAAGSCDPDGDALSYDWTFDDGGGAPGSSLQRTFSTPGLHFGTVTVTDSTGRSATATASVVVPAPAPPAFPGMALAPQRIRASKGRVVKVAVGCPAAAIGSCGGVLSLAGKKAAFFFEPGTAHKVGVKLSKKAFKKLRRKKHLTFTAVAVAHDANGSAKTTTAKITVLKPRR